MKKKKKRENKSKFKRYKIQEVIKPNQVILVQVLKDERGQKVLPLVLLSLLENILY